MQVENKTFLEDRRKSSKSKEVVTAMHRLMSSRLCSVRTSYSGTRVAPVAHIYYGISPTARLRIHTQDNKNKQLSALLRPLLNTSNSSS
jgi:hypothetical protein